MGGMLEDADKRAEEFRKEMAAKMKKEDAKRKEREQKQKEDNANHTIL